MEYVSIKHLGRTEYSEAWEIQKRLFEELLRQKREGAPEEQYVLFVGILQRIYRYFSCLEIVKCLTISGCLCTFVPEFIKTERNEL